jgi:hypothetical protein
VLADAGQRVPHGDAGPAEDLGRPDAADLQRLRGVERAPAEDHIAGRHALHAAAWPAARELHADRAGASSSTGVSSGWNIWLWFSDDLYGINNIDSLWFMGSMYVLAIVVYVVALFVRRNQGIDLKNVYREVPVE